MGERLSGAGRLAFALDAFLGLNAVAGGLVLVADPSGGAMGLPLALLEHSPFSTFLVPGLVLAGVVGGLPTWAAILVLRRAPRARTLTLASGVVLLGWLLIQIAMIRSLSWLHPAMAAVGLAQAAVALRWRVPAGARLAADAADFFAAGRVAFVGLSTDPRHFSRMVAAELAARGVVVVPVNPAASAQAPLEGVAWAGRVSDLQAPPASALLMVPPSAALAATEDCIAAGVRRVWFHRGAGPGSATPEAVARAREAGLTVITDACPLMVLAPVAFIHRAHHRLRFGASCAGAAR